LSHVINDYISDRSEVKSGKIKLIERRREYGPVGALVNIEDKLQDRFFLFYCDILFKTDLKEAYGKLDDSRFEALTFLTKDKFKMWSNMETKIDKNKKIVVDFQPGAYTHQNGWMDIGGAYNKSVIELLKKRPPQEEHINKNIWPRLISEKKLTYHLVGPVFDYGTEKNINTTREIFKREGLRALDEPAL
jgi:NDP-sugar pyrophosphorylase family protein